MTTLQNLPRAFGGYCCSGDIRTEPEDFRVDEVSQVVADGTGEHLLLQIEKRDSNTDWVARQLAEFAGVPRSDISYAGMKDRRAITRQFFSIRLAGRPEPAWSDIEGSAFRVLESKRHSRKLRPGTLRGNRFKLRIRSFQGDFERLDRKLGEIAARGIPNYFGEQRFGRDGANLDAAEAMFNRGSRRFSRHKRGIYISAARAHIFNRLLALRVQGDSWEHALPGERLVLNGTRNSFLVDPSDSKITSRLQAMDIHPSGPLWGGGELPTEAETANLERRVAGEFATLSEGLANTSLKHERRALRAVVADLEWTLEGTTLELGFYLPKGSFATALLREFVDYHNVA